MKLLITDNRTRYEGAKGNKLLIGSLKDLTLTAIEMSNFVDESKRLSINDLFQTYNLRYSEQVLTEISQLKDQLKSEHAQFFENSEGPTSSYLMGLLHNSVRQQLVKKYAVSNLIKIIRNELPGISKIDAHLGEDYSLTKDLASEAFSVQIVKANVKKRLHIQKLKSQLYRLFEFKKVFAPPDKPRWLMLLYDSIHHHELINQIYSSSLLNDIELVWLVIDSGLDKVSEIKSLLPESAKIVKFDSFKASPEFNGDKFIQLINPQMRNLAADQARLDQLLSKVKYAFMGRAFREIQPAKCFHIGYHEIGRTMVDVARKSNVPSYSLDYSYITDDYRFDKGIQFDHKFVPSEDQARIWKKRNDKSNHHIVGFPKYDEWLGESFDKSASRKKYQIGDEKVVLLASSYGFDDSIRKHQLEEVMKTCKRCNWSLIIKKHPLEVDDLVEQVTLEEPWVMVYHHHEISALEAISIADVTISAGSSIVMDCLFVGRPFISLSQNETSSFSDIMPVCSEGFVETITSLAQVEHAISTLIARDIDYDKIRDKYLGPRDGKSTDRILNVMLGQ